MGDERSTKAGTIVPAALAHDVREWCLNNGENPRYRIVLAGYLDEHDHLIPDTWRRHRWSASAAYQTANNGGQNADNRHKECLWMSPHCLQPDAQLDLFGGAA